MLFPRFDKLSTTKNTNATFFSSRRKYLLKKIHFQQNNRYKGKRYTVKTTTTSFNIFYDTTVKLH